MAKYVYPAIFTPEPEGGFSIDFPDLDCFSQGEDLVEGMEMAKDALCLTLYTMEQDGVTPPVPSAVRGVQVSGEQFVSLIECDTVEYRRFFDNKAVKKTLSIPSWLNDMAEREDINFSYVLQQALKERLHI